MTTTQSLRIGEAVLGGVVLALGLFIAIETARFAAVPGTAAVGPKLFPYLVATGLIVVGALVLREAFAGHIAHEGGGFELDPLAIGLVSAGLIAQMILLEWLGWIIATTILFMAVAAAFASRRFLIDAVIGLALTSLAFVVFTYGLGLSLPAGILGGLLGEAKP
jgi:putative tricarboxylic transport membrane protein